MYTACTNLYRLEPVADLGGGAADAFLPSGIRPPADPKGPPLYYLEISIFGEVP